MRKTTEEIPESLGRCFLGGARQDPYFWTNQRASGNLVAFDFK